MYKSLLLGLALFLPLIASAQAERSYHYAGISYVYDVHADTTVSVEETQTYAFSGIYHQADRSIPLSGLDTITDVEVVDASTGQSLSYAASKLDKNLPSSWNRYTVYYQNGKTYIEWYYDLSLTPDPSSHAWIVRYKLHGALAFYREHDELYWNLFTDYDVPVDAVDVLIRLPGEITAPQASFYSSPPLSYIPLRPDASSFRFLVNGIPAGADLTYAVGWQKGLVDQSAYRIDFLRTYWQFPAAAAVALAAIIFSIAYSRAQARKNRGRGTIVPQYEPPQGLRPAMAEVIAKGRISSKAWPATVVDRAVRGFLRIEEIPPVLLNRFFKVALYGAGWAALVGVLFLFRNGGMDWESYILIFFVAAVSLILLPFRLFGHKLSWQIKEYRLTLLKDAAGAGLEDYEAEFLRILFPKGETEFSTKDLKKSITRRSEVSHGMDVLEKKLYKEAQADTKAFEITPKTGLVSVKFIYIRMAILLVFGGFLVGAPIRWWPLIVTVLCALALVSYIVFGKTRLNRQGNILKEEWLGFKMYLETAERYRLQNLTPELFEKYLPYAIVFGIEKKWANAFEGIASAPPSWYVGSGGAYSPGVAGNFSPSGFSAAFSASFVTSFASSGGSGASGGGGGAGGGGGGGGGGAS
ncbi:MAG TPA: DUF2207 domain-containing protein [Candidatus Paceibacterota bacterium]|nr:DUF2207 domain-containing protein [Candidatus Paceibacterota bacterium]